MLQMEHFISFFLKFKSNLLVKRVFFLLNAAFAMAILDLISRVQLPSFFNMLPKYLKHSLSGEINKSEDLLFVITFLAHLMQIIFSLIKLHDSVKRYDRSRSVSQHFPSSSTPSLVLWARCQKKGYF